MRNHDDPYGAPKGSKLERLLQQKKMLLEQHLNATRAANNCSSNIWMLLGQQFAARAAFFSAAAEKSFSTSIYF
ncbi:hypothetical protein DPMN_118677 [Dreissena polymorpha]|uniref:Uncharacterized protein n=1 Tax=Dreissena polymorpha TaxID=45954 RepID=A0A9D4GHT2_DREPO|nr:hypothetical protein DPMN_118677 [Dreissena polymorpha]